jgi:Ca-activated chloride channel family protein
MVFIWPTLLWLLLLAPLLVLLYWWLLHRRKKTALTYSSLSLVREAMGPGQRLRRHIPPLLFLLALIALLLAAARPMAVITLPAQNQTIMLAMDVSGSMRATDVEPDRITAAQNAAKAFIAELPRHVRVGIVAFAGSAQLAQLPTQSREDLIKAIDSFQLQRGTATGNGIMLSLATIFPDAGIDISALGGRQAMRPKSIDEISKKQDQAKAFVPVAPGSYSSAAVIMLTDGILRIHNGSEITDVPLKQGQAYMRAAGITHDVMNGSDHPIAFVEIEVKNPAAMTRMMLA